VVIPRIEFTISYIEKELDEESREDFFRLKRVTDNKKAEKANALREADLKASSQGGAQQQHQEEVSESIFGNEEEDEILF
jgi:V-type H+-transporting ATPase subunit D